MAEDHRTVIGQNVARQRKILRLTQEGLAEAAGLTRSTVASIEVGRQEITVSTLIALAGALLVPYTYLLPVSRATGLAELDRLRGVEADLAARVGAAIKILNGHESALADARTKDHHR